MQVDDTESSVGRSASDAQLITPLCQTPSVTSDQSRTWTLRKHSRSSTGSLADSVNQLNGLGENLLAHQLQLSTTKQNWTTTPLEEALDIAQDDGMHEDDLMEVTRLFWDPVIAATYVALKSPSCHRRFFNMERTNSRRGIMGIEAAPGQELGMSRMDSPLSMVGTIGTGHLGRIMANSLGNAAEQVGSGQMEFGHLMGDGQMWNGHSPI
ncbi:hypothetical protein M427DRAFT_49045 [Gonapodya prolifera JEL478]|uniref:Uncharacterized protein n=1 Tax=Gonapodya prolifera (strain JEL478) TaxID=1344416 RepID=A0A139A0I4_GONPJ|nr:hypothetical protein M427DRAFT_49045 [Gonapodya prolifera JEL478]|eukprot:KXS09873.1 hypothetical protein M427DRAFT_49045 [Gonapodya prolifera JEL478]